MLGSSTPKWQMQKAGPTMGTEVHQEVDVSRKGGANQQ